MISERDKKLLNMKSMKMEIRKVVPFIKEQIENLCGLALYLSENIEFEDERKRFHRIYELLNSMVAESKETDELVSLIEIYETMLLDENKQ